MDRSSDSERARGGISSHHREWGRVLHGRADQEIRIPEVAATAEVGLSLAGRSAAQLRPPLVSFVLVNWNYGRYIGATIDSILAQDYPHFECVILDNGSTDDSRAVIDRHVRGDRRFRVIHLPENLGQLGATLVALGEVKGGFVTFVDSDDLLFPDFASTHLQVHLSAPRSVAVTTSGVAEVDGAGVVLTSQFASIQLDRHGVAKGLRDASTVIRLSTIPDERFTTLHALTAVVPRWTKGWLWAPGTGNMIRRSVLEMVAFNDRNATYMRSADGHFLPLCHAFAGTALIDVPLSAYRIHGENYFVNRESLLGIPNGTPEYAAKSRRESYESVASILENARQNAWLLRESFWRVVDISTRVHSDDLKAYYGAPSGVEIFERHAATLREAVGDRAFIQNICARFGFRDARRIIAKGFGGRAPARLQLKIFRLCRNRKRMKALLH